MAYGAHERCRLDLYLAQSPPGPTPLVLLIHGGGFRSGDKSKWGADKATRELLAKGISCAAVKYSYLDHMPVQDILKQCARAVQFLRSRACEWNLDKARFASMEGSAGAGTPLWLATRDDLRDPDAADPVLRESTRLSRISKDDPPLYLSNPQVVEAPSNRGEWLHCIHHARQVGRECKADEVKCILLQDQPEPKPGVVEFLTQHLRGVTL